MTMAAALRYKLRFKPIFGGASVIWSSSGSSSDLEPLADVTASVVKETMPAAA
jgi:hypothetical protein